MSAVLGMAFSWAEVCGQPLGVDASTSIGSRVGEVPPEILERYAERGEVVPTTYDLTAEERRKLLAALEVLTPLQETIQTSFARGVWENQVTPVSAYRGDILDNVPWPAGERVDIENAQALYEDLERTPFVSIYASLMVVEDLAELVAWREMTEKHGQPYRIEIRNDAELVYSYEPMTSYLVRSRLNQLERFDSPEG